MANATSPFSEKENTADANNTDNYYDYFHVYDWAFYSLTLLSCLAGLVGNSIVIWLLSFGIKRNPFTTYILNLAVADFGTLLGLSINVAAILPNVSLAFSLLYAYIHFTYNASLYFLTAISLERCLSVLFPIWYRCHRPARLSAVVSGFLWIIPGLLFGTLFVFDGYLSMENEIMVLNAIFTLDLLIFAPTVVVSTLIMSVKICHSSQRRQPPRLYITILVTLLFFLIFAVPLSAEYFVVINTNAYFYHSGDLSFLSASVNSSINPIIYYFVGRNRKKSREPLKVVLKRALGDGEMCQGGT